MSHAPAHNRRPSDPDPQAPSGESGFYNDAYEWCEQCVKRHPGASVLVMFGAGLAVGALIGHVLGDPPRDDTSRANRLGRRALDALAGVLPDSLSDRLRS